MCYTKLNIELKKAIKDINLTVPRSSEWYKIKYNIFDLEQQIKRFSFEI